MTTITITEPTESAAEAAFDALSNMRGRSFGVDYVTEPGKNRRMLAQIERLTGTYVVIREINLTKRKREEEPTARSAYRTLRLAGISEIRVGGNRHIFH